MQCHNKEFCIFFQESLFTKAIENFPLVFLYPDINTLGVGKILDSYATVLHNKYWAINNFLSLSDLNTTSTTCWKEMQTLPQTVRELLADLHHEEFKENIQHINQLVT